MFEWIVGCLTTIIVVTVLCGSMVYSCDRASTQYYEAQKNCLDSGGTWLKQSGDAYGANCLRLK